MNWFRPLLQYALLTVAFAWADDIPYPTLTPGVARADISQ
jgi:hypothetical protein